MRDKVRRLGQEPARPDENAPIEHVVAEVPKANLGVSLEDLLAKQGLLGEDNVEETPTPEPHNGVDVLASKPASFVVQKIPVDFIDPSPYQPRKDFDQERLSLLADAIQATGLLNPILVRPSTMVPGRFELVGGERRWRAVKLLQWSEIDARIKEMSDIDAQVNAVTDNESHALSDYERACAFQTMLEDNKNWDMQTLARHVGVSKSTMTRCMAYFKLPQAVLDILSEKPSLIGTRAVAEFTAFVPTYESLVVEGVRLIAEGKSNQQESLRWIQRQIRAQENPTTVQPPASHLIANGKLLGKIKVKANSVEIICEKGVNVPDLAELVKSLIASQAGSPVGVKEE